MPEVRRRLAGCGIVGIVEQPDPRDAVGERMMQLGVQREATAVQPLAQVRLLLQRLHAEGVTVFYSSHVLSDVEALCTRIALIDHGRTVLYGPVHEIKRNFAGNAITLEGEGDFNDLPGVLEARQINGTWQLALAIGANPQQVFQSLAGRSGVRVERFELAEPSLDDIFVTVVQEEAPGREAAHA